MDGESSKPKPTAGRSSQQGGKSKKKVSMWSKLRVVWKTFRTLKKFQYDPNSHSLNFDDAIQRYNDPDFPTFSRRYALLERSSTVENPNPNDNETGVSKETK